jgi:hypothetical protein
MNRELERLISAWEEVSASKDKEVPPKLRAFDLIDRVMERKPNVSREILRKSVIKAHRVWALKQDSKPRQFPQKRERPKRADTVRALPVDKNQ